MISRILGAISDRVSYVEFLKILDDNEIKMKYHKFNDKLSGMDKGAR